jgi:hypothetical protein
MVVHGTPGFCGKEPDPQDMVSKLYNGLSRLVSFSSRQPQCSVLSSLRESNRFLRGFSQKGK